MRALMMAAALTCVAAMPAQADVFTLDCGNKIYVTIDSGPNKSMILDEPGIVSAERLEVQHMTDDEYAAGAPSPSLASYVVNRKTGELVIHELTHDQFYRHICTKTAGAPKPETKF